MARDFSSRYLEELRFPNLPELHMRLRAQRLIRVLRWAERKLTPRMVIDRAVQLNGRELVTPALERAQAHLRTHRWAFCENILDEEFHRALLGGWPKRRFFAPASTLEKSWDRGFDWRRGQTEDPAYLDDHTALKRLLNYLRSESFARRFSELCGEEDLSCFSFTATMTVPGSVVAPHLDDWAFLSNGPRAAYNLVLNVNGSGGPGSGGLSILKSNTFEEVVFESLKLNNSALVYDTTAPFYHGFKPVERGKFRWAIISNFVSSGYGR